MTKKNKAVAVFAVLGLFIGAGGAAHAQLVQNGSFDTTSAFGQIGPNATVANWSTTGYNFIFSPSNLQTGVPGSDGTIEIWGPLNGSNNGLTTSPDGGNLVGLDSNFESAPLSQTINGLTIGDKYDVSFYWAAAQQESFSGPTTDNIQVSLGADTQTTPTLDIDSHGFSGWKQQTFQYTASAGSEVLSFLAVGTPSGSNPPFVLLDGVSMGAQSGVPEPTAVASLFAGMIGLGVFARRRARAAKSAS